MADDICGYEKPDGKPCQLPDCRPDGRCWHHTDVEDGQPENVGRPTKLTHQRQETIAQAMESGHSFRAACGMAGIDKSTGFRWMKVGEDQDEGIFSDFHDRITRARGVGTGQIEQSIVEICESRQDAATLLRYLQHIEGGLAGAQDDELAGINLIVPEAAKRQ